jgi:D-glycerate 3-kinase
VDALRAALAPLAPKARVDRYYLPVARWCEARVAAASARPFVLGVSGPQGSGKSTLADALVAAFGAVGLRGIAISIDDFYLTHAEQNALAARFPGNRYLEHRGYPGTHDVALGRSTLGSLVEGRPTFVPVYDKSAHGGRGDRGRSSSYRRVEERLDFLVLEGWMLGFSPVDPAGLAPDLRPPNEMLAAYAVWHETLEAFVHLRAASLDDIVGWRIGSERARRERGEGALTDAQARDYIERFLPAYRTYLPGLATAPPCAEVLCVELGADRDATSVGDTPGS